VAGGASTEKGDPLSNSWRDGARGLAGYGFKDSDIQEALAECEGDKTVALYTLLAELYPESAFDESTIDTEDDSLWDQLQSQRDDERSSLESILSPEELTIESPECIKIQVRWSLCQLERLLIVACR